MSETDSSNASHTVFDKVAGKAKEVLGAVVGDEDLKDEGKLQQSKAAVAQRAVELGAEADHAERAAALAAEQAENAIAQQRVAGELAARERSQQLEHERSLAESAIEREAAQRETAVQRQSNIEDQAIERRERALTSDLVDGVAEAAEIDLDADRAEAAAQSLNNVQQQLGDN